MTHVALKRPSFRGSGITETCLDLEAGDDGTMLVTMNLRAEEDPHSEVLDTMPEGTHFTVIEVAGNHRCLISAGKVTGWVSTKTDLDQPLCTKGKSHGIQMYENLVPLNLREDQDFKSTVIASLPRGTQFQFIEEGTYNRAKIQVDGTIGWITSKTDLNQNLIKKVGEASSFKPYNLVDNYVMKSFSQKSPKKAEVDGSGVTKTKSGRIVEAPPAPTPAAAPKEAPAPAKKTGLKKLAFCCS